MTHASRSRWLPLARWLAYGLVALGAAQGAAGLLLAGMNRLSLWQFVAQYVVVGVLTTVAFALMGALILVRRPSNAIGWLLGAVSVLAGLGSWAGQYARYTFITYPGALPFGDVAAWLYICPAFGPFVALTTLFLPLFFPDGRLPSPRWRPVAWLAFAATSLFTLALAISPGPIDASLAEVPNPFAVPGSEGLVAVIEPLAVALWMVSAAGAIAALVVRFRGAEGARRAQIKWLAYASTLLVMATVLPPLLNPESISDPANGDTFVSGLMLALAYPLVPAAVGVAIMRYRLYDIDLLINRTLVYAALTACVAAIYLVVVVGLGALLHAEGSVALSLAGTALAALLFQPLRERLQRGVNRLLYGERDDPYAALARLGERLEQSMEPQAVLETIVGTVRESLKLAFATIVLEQGGEPMTAATAGRLGAVALHIPIAHQGEALGALIVGQRSPGEALSSADRRLLADLARQAGVAAHTVRLTFELQRARERLVLAREEERRRLRRDLHDGLGAALAGQAMTVGAVRFMVADDHPAADSLLAQLQATMDQTLREVRRLVYNLRPPALDELGLVEAVRASLAPYGLPGAAGKVHITLHAPDTLAGLPAAVEVAALRIVQEALANVERHAQARHCLVRLQASDTLLEVEVADDGVGLEANGRQGVGLRSMRERAEELGGSLLVTPQAGGGTRVVARLPLGAPSGKGRTSIA